MILLKLTFVSLLAMMVTGYPTEKKVVESEKSTKQEKIVEFGADGKKNEKILQSSESVHYPAISPMFYGYHPFPYVTHYAPSYYPHTYGGFGGQQNGLTSNYGAGYGYGGSSYGSSGFGSSGFGYGGLSHGYGGGVGGGGHGYSGHGHEHGHGHGHEHGSLY